MKKRLLIFGSGFLVRHITNEALINQYEVEIIYNEHIITNFEGIVQHKLSETNLRELLHSYKPCYILFAYGESVVSANSDINFAINKNVMLILSILEEILLEVKLKKVLKKIIIIGSAAEYGRAYCESISEEYPVHPSSIYGLSKIFLFNTAMYYHEKGLPIVYTRQFNAIGPFQRDTFVLSSFCKQVAMIEKNSIDNNIMVGEMSHKRDFIDARDAARAYLLIFSKGKVGEVYNIGSGKAYSVQELLNLVLESSVLKGELSITKDNTLIFKKNTLSNTLISNNTKLRSLGFNCIYSLDRTVSDTLNYWRAYV